MAELSPTSKLLSGSDDDTYYNSSNPTQDMLKGCDDTIYDSSGGDSLMSCQDPDEA